jgi:hypothetical protein
MWWWSLLVGCADDPLVTAWHRSFAIERARSAQETEGACEPPLEDGGTDAPYGFLAVSPGLPDVASLYLCDGPAAEDCPAQPVGNIWIRRWTTEVLAGETGVSGVFGNLCTLSWNGIDARRRADGTIQVELRAAARQEALPDPEDCDQALESLIRSSCDAVLVLEGVQE